MQLQNIIRFSLNLEFLKFKLTENLAPFQIWRLRNDDFGTSSKAEVNLRLQNISLIFYLKNRPLPLFSKQTVYRYCSPDLMVNSTAPRIMFQFNFYTWFIVWCLIMCECILLFDLVMKKHEEKLQAITGLLIKSFWKRQSDVQSINGCQLKPNYWWVCC